MKQMRVNSKKYKKWQSEIAKVELTNQEMIYICQLLKSLKERGELSQFAIINSIINKRPEYLNQ
jgi:hypothetical protein